MSADGMHIFQHFNISTSSTLRNNDFANGYKCYGKNDPICNKGYKCKPDPICKINTSIDCKKDVGKVCVNHKKYNNHCSSADDCNTNKKGEICLLSYDQKIGICVAYQSSPLP